MKKTLGLIIMIISILSLLFYFENITALVVLNNYDLYSEYYPVFGFILFFISLILLTSRNTPNNLEDAVAHVWTAKGSVYAYHGSGKTQRTQKRTGKTHEPQDALVFIPPYSWVEKNAPQELSANNTFGDNEIQYHQTLLDYVQDPTGHKHVYIVDRSGRKLKTNQEIAAAPEVFLDFRTGDNRDFSLPVSKKPKLGYTTFDMRSFQEGGKEKREIHKGNKVIRITYKDGRIEE